MGKEFDLGTGRTAVGDNHWMGSGRRKSKKCTLSAVLQAST
jgi:hypothetical protein